MEQEKEEYETVYYVTAPFANNEEEIATSFIVDTDEIGQDQVIILNEDCSVVLNENSSFVDDESSHMEHNDSPVIENEENSVIENEESSLTTIEESSTVINEEKTSSVGTGKKSDTDSDSSGPDDGPGSSKPARPVTPNPPVPVDKLTCKYCFKTFTKSGNKMRHIRQVHKIKKEIGSHIRCIECNTCYKHVQKLRDHLQSVHKLNMAEEEIHFPNMTGNKYVRYNSRIWCAECDINFGKVQSLRDHLREVHNSPMDFEVYRFPNMDAFKKWKHDMERKELSSFTLRHGARKTVMGMKFFYVCHRSGRYISRVSTPRQRMLKSPGTCKLGIVCTAAIYCEECPNEVVVKYCPHHYGHGKETSFVQLSSEEQAAIQENVSNGIPFENLLDDIRDCQSSTDHFQLYLLKKRDIRFINNAFNAVEYNPGLSDAESVDQWVHNCYQMEESPILYYRQEEFANSQEDFLLIIMTEFQKQILLSSDKQVVCVDSLYRRKGGRFYLTVLFIMDEYDIAFPVAYCISSKVDKSVITQFFVSIKESTGPLECMYFMSDSERFYYDAWIEVMNVASKWLWSMWYVDNRIRVQLRIFKGNIMKRAEVYKTMRVLLECQNQNVFQSMFKNYVDSLMSDTTSKHMGNFILQKYGNNAHMWAYCFRKDIKLSTNIHLEVMHRTFRYCCREGRKKRLDKFIFVIMKLVRYKMLDRLTMVLDEEKINLAVEAINMFHSMGLEIPTENISSLSDKIWLIRSDEEENVYVTREFETCPEHCNLKCTECDICVHMYSCSCVHSMINANLCQHIHAVVWKFLTPHFSPPESPVHDCDVDMEEVNTIEIPDKCSELLDNVLKRTHDLYKKVRANKCTLNKESLTAIMKRVNESVDICTGKPIPEEKKPESPSKNAVYVINPYVKKDTQPLILPKTLPTILPNNKQMSQYVLLVQNK